MPASDPKRTITGTNSVTPFEPRSGSQIGTEMGADSVLFSPELNWRRIILGQRIRRPPRYSNGAAVAASVEFPSIKNHRAHVKPH